MRHPDPSRALASPGTLFVVDWDAEGAEDLQCQLRSLWASGGAAEAWQVLNCATTPLQAGQRRTGVARWRLALQYLGVAVTAAWRSRRHTQVVVWRQAIGYLICLLPRWPGWLCVARAGEPGRRPRLIMTTVLLSPSSTAPRSWRRLLFRLALRRADVLIYFSREMAQDTARHHPAQAHKVFWMRLPQFDEPAEGDDPGETHVARGPELVATPLSVFAGGTSDRDFDVVIDAFRDPPVPVTIVCREDQAFRPPGPAGAHFTVRRGVSEAEYHALAAAAGVAVVALKQTASGCGQLLFTFCMRRGIPVIATDCFGTRDYVIHGHSGWLVPAGDARALRQAYDHLAADPALRQRLAHQARAVARTGGLASFVRAIEALGLAKNVPPAGGPFPAAEN